MPVSNTCSPRTGPPKLEYQYYNFGSTTFTGGPAEIVGARFRDDEHTVKVGLNYRFGWGGPVVAETDRQSTDSGCFATEKAGFAPAFLFVMLGAIQLALLLPQK